MCSRKRECSEPRRSRSAPPCRRGLFVAFGYATVVEAAEVSRSSSVICLQGKGRTAGHRRLLRPVAAPSGMGGPGAEDVKRPLRRHGRWRPFGCFGCHCLVPSSLRGSR